MENTELKHRLRFLGPALSEEISIHARVNEFPAGTELLRPGQYIKVIPVVISGLVKVFSRYEDKELLLYYIEPNETCTMSFASSLKNEPSRVAAITEEDSSVLLLPVKELTEWSKTYPTFNDFFFGQFNKRYAEMLDTVNQLLFDRLEDRILDYLKEKVRVSGSELLNLKHRQIAAELGTAREVVSRILKKLEIEGKLEIRSGGLVIV